MARGSKDDLDAPWKTDCFLVLVLACSRHAAEWPPRLSYLITRNHQHLEHLYTERVQLLGTHNKSLGQSRCHDDPRNNLFQKYEKLCARNSEIWSHLDTKKLRRLSEISWRGRPEWENTCSIYTGVDGTTLIVKLTTKTLQPLNNTN